MSVYRQGLTIRLLTASFLACVILLLLGRNHFILGTALIAGRWFLIVVGGLLFYWSTRKGILRTMRLLLFVALIVMVADYFWDRWQRASLVDGDHGIEVSLMSYNLFFKNGRPDLAIERIREMDPDILAVQELTPQLAGKMNILHAQYPHRRLVPLRGTHGIGLYSKYPIIGHQLLGGDVHPFAQMATMKIGKETLQLINVHLASPAIAVENPDRFLSLLSTNYDLRKDQLAEISAVASEPGTKILMGDLNTTSYEPLYRDHLRHWVDLYSFGDGSRSNFPNSGKTKPFLTLDYIFAHGRLTGLDFEVVEGGSSDHLAVFGQVRF